MEWIALQVACLALALDQVEISPPPFTTSVPEAREFEPSEAEGPVRVREDSNERDSISQSPGGYSGPDRFAPPPDRFSPPVEPWNREQDDVPDRQQGSGNSGSRLAVPETEDSRPGSSRVAPAAAFESAPVNRAVNPPVNPAANSLETMEGIVTLLGQLMAPPRGDTLTGRPTSLVEVLHSPDVQQRKRAVRAYWTLAVTIAEHAFAVEEAEFLAESSPAEEPHEQAVLAAVQAAAAARVQETRVRVLEQQHLLAEEAMLVVRDELPWPSDPPYVGAYRTRFEQFFGGQAQPLRLQQIDRLLPDLLQHVVAESEAMLASEDAATAVQEAHRRGRASLMLMLETHQQLREQRRKLLAAVQIYNEQIAEYALTVTGRSATPPELLASTLIRVPPRDASQAGGGGVEPGGASATVSRPLPNQQRR